MPNSFAVTQFVSNAILCLLQNDLRVAAMFNTDWNAEYTRDFAIGETVTIKRPSMLTVTSGLALQLQNQARITTTATIGQPVNIHFMFDQFEKLLLLERSDEELIENYLHPYARRLAQRVDTDAAIWATNNANNIIGTLGADYATIDFATLSKRRLVEKGMVEGEMCIVLSPSVVPVFARNNIALFNPSSDVSKMYREGILYQISGFDIYESPSLVRFTAGTAATHGVTVYGAGQSGSTLLVTGTAADTILQGDKFSVASVNAVNPMTQLQGSLGLMTFVATAPLTLSGNNGDSLSISPALYPPASPYQNTDSTPGNTAALTFWPGTPSPSGASGVISLALTEWAFALVSGKMPLPENGVGAVGEYVTDPDTGVTLNYVRAWDQHVYATVHRLDMCYGFGNLYNDNGCVAICGA